MNEKGLVANLPNDRSASMHLSISDSSGDSAIFEYLDGKLSIHHNRDYTVMTNSPKYEEQLALCQYWKNINGMSFSINAIPKNVDKNYITALPDKSYHQQVLASVSGVIRAAGVPSA